VPKSHRQDNCRGDDRTRKRSPARFVDSGNTRATALMSGAFVPQTAFQRR
jgi:hypothetical protein